MPENDLLARLREAAQSCHTNYTGERALTPEQVQRGLERMRDTELCNRCQRLLEQSGYTVFDCDACWAAMLDSFLVGVRDA